MLYIVFSTKSDFAGWLAGVNVIKGYDDGRGTQSYTAARQGVDGKYYAAIRDDDLPILDDMDQTWASIVDASTMQQAMPDTESSL